MFCVGLLLLLVCQARKIAGYDPEKSNYGDVSSATQRFFKETNTTASDEPNQDIMYFFSLHDYNKDHHLDGHELALAFMGYEFYHEKEEIPKEISQVDMEFMIDHALLEDDKDNDGKISWIEYLESQKYHHLIPK